MESGEHRVLPSILPHERENKQFIVPNDTFENESGHYYNYKGKQV